MRSSRILVAIFGGGFPLIGIVLVLIGVSLYVSHERARDSGVLTSGSVVGMEEWYDDEGSMYAPIVRFTTKEGEVVEFTSSTWSRPAEYGPGDTVEVLYQPDDPHAAEIETQFERYFASVFLGLTGLLLAAIGAIVAFVVHRFLSEGLDTELPAGTLEVHEPRPRRPARPRGRRSLPPARASRP